jgi:hypothetical protein
MSGSEGVNETKGRFTARLGRAPIFREILPIFAWQLVRGGG